MTDRMTIKATAQNAVMFADATITPTEARDIASRLVNAADDAEKCWAPEPKGRGFCLSAVDYHTGSHTLTVEEGDVRIIYTWPRK